MIPKCIFIKGVGECYLLPADYMDDIFCKLFHSKLSKDLVQQKVDVLSKRGLILEENKFTVPVTLNELKEIKELYRKLIEDVI